MPASSHRRSPASWRSGEATIRAVERVDRLGAWNTRFGAEVFQVQADLRTDGGQVVTGTAEGAYPADSWLGLTMPARYDPADPRRFVLEPLGT